MRCFPAVAGLVLVLASLAACSLSAILGDAGGRLVPKHHGAVVAFLDKNSSAHPSAVIHEPVAAHLSKVTDSGFGNPDELPAGDDSASRNETRGEAPARGVLLSETGGGVQHPPRQDGRDSEELSEDTDATWRLWDDVLWTTGCVTDLDDDGGGGGVLDCVLTRSALVMGRLLHLAPGDNVQHPQQLTQDTHSLGFSARKKKVQRHMHRFMKMMHALAKLLMLGLPFLLFLKLKAVVLVSLAAGALVLLAGKSFVLSVVSFALSMVAALKNSSAGHGQRLEDVYPLRRTDEHLLEGARSSSSGLFM